MSKEAKRAKYAQSIKEMEVRRLKKTEETTKGKGRKALEQTHI